MKIVASLRVKLTRGEGALVLAKRVKNLDVYLKSAQWTSAFEAGTQEGVLRSGQLAREIIEMEPGHPIGYRLLGWYHHALAGSGVSPGENYKKAFRFCQKALSLDEYDGWSHALLSHIYLKGRKYDKAIESGRRSIEIFPNNAFVHGVFGRTLCGVGQLDEGIASIKKGLRLNPFPAFWYYTYLGNCYNQKRQHEDALAEFKKALQRASGSPLVYGYLAITYALLDREEDARASAAKCLELAPHVSVSMFSKTSISKNQAYKELLLDAMRKAGFPE